MQRTTCPIALDQLRVNWSELKVSFYGWKAPNFLTVDGIRITDPAQGSDNRMFVR
ncbi:hypothetical protein [uncultured Sphingomonas sp.]|uniref:hypothetical protein n=1 Tax=uncultured Sphingomonas sp. TaxID=158754 RepID=UPI0025F1B59F|nr:hypothetical protein [uncultured Sphingomonas sp.]